MNDGAAPRTGGHAASPFREEHRLADGTVVTVRSIRPDDAPQLKAGFERLSPSSRYQRFLGAVHQLDDGLLRYLTEVDGHDHVAIVCTTESHDMKSEVGLGVARFVRLASEPHVAEAAITVPDEAQGRGIGRLLLRCLTSLAAAHGVRVFRAEVLAENLGMRTLLAEVGAEPRPAVEGGAAPDDGDPVPTLVFDVRLDEPTEQLTSEPSHPLRRLLRSIAGEIQRLPRPPSGG